MPYRRRRPRTAWSVCWSVPSSRHTQARMHALVGMFQLLIVPCVRASQHPGDESFDFAYGELFGERRWPVVSEKEDLFRCWDCTGGYSSSQDQ